MKGNVLLITTGYNNDKSNSWLVFKKIVQVFRNDSDINFEILCFAPVFWKPKISELSEVIIRLPLKAKVLSALINRFTRKYSYLSACYYAKKYVQQVLRLIDSKSVDKLWINSDLMSVLILNEILKYRQISYHITVFDDPFTYKFYQPFKDDVLPIYYKLLASANSIDTPTSELYNYYQENGIIGKTTKVAQSYVGVFKRNEKCPIIHDRVKRICLTGSIYGIDALAAFIEAIRGRIENKQLEFHLYTNAPALYVKYMTKQYPILKKIVLLPFVKEVEIVDRLQEYDLLYLPVLFESERRFQANTSFPSKTHNYLAAGVPIIFHVPYGTALHSFAVNNNIGFILDTLDSEKIKASMETWDSKDVRTESRDVLIKASAAFARNAHIYTLYMTIVN